MRGTCASKTAAFALDRGRKWESVWIVVIRPVGIYEASSGVHTLFPLESTPNLL